MIQRIQTFYLFVVVALMGLSLWLPIACFVPVTDLFALTAFGVRDAAGVTVQPTLYLGILLSVACLLPLVTIFLYKHRLLQIRLCAVELVVLLGAEAMMLIYYFLCSRYFEVYEPYIEQMKVAIGFPLVCLVFDFLALRAIFRDEKLVRSLDRIR